VLTLYDNADSTNALKVRFGLAELGLAYQRITVPLDTKPAWYRDIHPFGLVPTLVDGDVIVTESNTALRYLADREGRDDLYPRAAAARAHIDGLLDSLSLEVRPALWAAEEVVIYGTSRDGDWRPALYAALSAYDRLIARAAEALGPFSIADCAIAGRMQHLDRLPIDRGAYPHLIGRLDAARVRPAYSAAL
jgi:glutathione S-transferase